MAARVSPDLEVAEARRAISRAEVQIVGTVPNPTVSVSTARETARLGATLGQPLLLFGQRSTGVRASEGDAETSLREMDVVRLEVLHNASVAWIDLWESERRAALLDTAARDAVRVADIARLRFEAGSAPRLDVVRAAADGARARADSQAAARLVSAAAARLDYFVGRSIASDADPSAGPGLRRPRARSRRRSPNRCQRSTRWPRI